MVQGKGNKTEKRNFFKLQHLPYSQSWAVFLLINIEYNTPRNNRLRLLRTQFNHIFKCIYNLLFHFLSRYL